MGKYGMGVVGSDMALDYIQGLHFQCLTTNMPAPRCGSGTPRKGGFVISDNVKARNTVIIFLHIDPFEMEVIEMQAG